MTNQSMPMNGTNSSLPMNGNFELDWGEVLNLGLNTASNIVQQNAAARAAQAQAQAAQAQAQAQAAQAQSNAEAAARALEAQQELLQMQMDAERQSYQLQQMQQQQRTGSSDGGLVDRIKNWWARATTGEKLLAGVVVAGLTYGTYKGFKYVINKNKTGRKK